MEEIKSPMKMLTLCGRIDGGQTDAGTTHTSRPLPGQVLSDLGSQPLLIYYSKPTLIKAIAVINSKSVITLLSNG